MNNVAGSELLTVPEAAALLKLKVSTIRAWICQRKISYVKLGGRLVRIRRSDAEAFIAAGLRLTDGGQRDECDRGAEFNDRF